MNIVRTLLVAFLALGGLTILGAGCGDDGGDGGDGGGGGGGCESSCTEYYEAYNVCTEDSGGTAWSDDDIASFCDISLACDYYDYGAYFECLTAQVPDDCAGGTWGTEVCTLE